MQCKINKMESSEEQANGAEGRASSGKDMLMKNLDRTIIKAMSISTSMKKMNLNHFKRIRILIGL